MSYTHKRGFVEVSVLLIIVGDLHHHSSIRVHQVPLKELNQAESFRQLLQGAFSKCSFNRRIVHIAYAANPTTNPAETATQRSAFFHPRSRAKSSPSRACYEESDGEDRWASRGGVIAFLKEKLPVVLGVQEAQRDDLATAFPGWGRKRRR